jgi:ABC-2 type transport system ATP-binding protein
MLRDVGGVTAVTRQDRHVIVHGNGPLLSRVAVALSQYNITPTDLHVEQANLEDVFLALTGHKIRE